MQYGFRLKDKAVQVKDSSFSFILDEICNSHIYLKREQAGRIDHFWCGTFLKLKIEKEKILTQFTKMPR